MERSQKPQKSQSHIREKVETFLQHRKIYEREKIVQPQQLYPRSEIMLLVDVRDPGNEKGRLPFHKILSSIIV